MIEGLADPIDRAAGEVTRRTGLRFDLGLRQRLRRAVAEAAARAGVSEPAWVRRLEDDDAALAHIVTQVTIQESGWFRDRAQFDALRTTVLPRLRTPVIWSVGAALGQEAYSLAMTLREAGHPEVRVVATDVSVAAVEGCARARYPLSLLGGLDATRRQRWLRPVGDEWEVDETLRRQVLAMRHNVATDPVPAEVAGCQVVFCRNVLIYMTDQAMEQALSRVAALLPAAGALFLGGGEALWRALRRFEPVELPGCYSYRPRSDRRAAPAAAAAAASPPAARRPAATPAAPSWPEPEAVTAYAAGNAAFEAGDADTAVRLLRQATYIDPDLAVAHFTLGVVLSAGGDTAGARRAWEAARAAVGRADPADVEDALDGHSASALTLAIDARLEGLP
ncbi:MAG TPA: CheR family methyltransferase [Acidimicrobiales bacterium]